MALRTHVDERTFENAVTLSAEETASNAEHFEAKAEKNGTSVKVETGPTSKELVEAKAAPPKEQEIPKDTAVTAPVDSAAPVIDNPDLNEEDRADWQTATNDGERLGHYAKRTKKINELKATVEEKDKRLAELERQLAEKSKQPAQNPLVQPSAKQEPPKVEEPPKPEAPKVATFEKPKPVAKLPKFSDYQDAEDPIAAHAEAVAQAAADHAEMVSDWKDEKRDFERSEAKRVEKESQKQTEDQERQAEEKRIIDQKFADARSEHSDLDQILTTTEYTPALQHLFLVNLSDGVKLAYQLGLPKNAEVLKAITAITQTTAKSTPKEVDAALNNGLQALAVFREKVKAESVTPPVVTQPVVTETAVVKEPVVQSPPVVTQQRKEDAAPIPVRGRAGAPVERPEDVDPMDSDARRRLRRQLERR